MCDIGEHDCPHCGEGIKCYASNYECSKTDHNAYPCARCEYWIDDQRREDEREAEMWEWAKENSYDKDS